MLQFRTQGFNGYAVKYSPFFDSRIAVATAANFGLVGNGRLYILNLTAQGAVAEKWFDTQDALYDLSWSEQHENQLIAGAGDGSVKLFDIGVDNFPVQSWQEHKREVFAVSWNLAAKDTFCSSSWDGTVKVWSPHRQTSLMTLPTHSCTYSAAYSPHEPSIISAVSSDSHLRIFDLRTPSSAQNHMVLRIPIHQAPQPQQTDMGALAGQSPLPPQFQANLPPAEALTHDWNKYRPTVVATAGVDRVIRTFDTRAPDKGPLAVLPGHGYAIRRVSWSPHVSDTLLSASYDMTVRVWDDGSTMRRVDGRSEPLIGPGGTFGGGRELGRMERHTEFAMGVDWCLFGSEGWCASCGWDEQVLIWDAKVVMGRTR